MAWCNSVVCVCAQVDREMRTRRVPKAGGAARARGRDF